MKKHLYILISLIFSGYLHATIINIPADQPTIQAGIDEAVIGDTVLVQPGTYLENINYNGKNITVASLFLTSQDTSYISQTIIDGDSIGRVMTFENGVDSTAVLCGFTITNGYASWIGGGIYCNNSSPVLQNLMILNNEATGPPWGTGAYGGGIACENEANPILQNLFISNNVAKIGGGIYCVDSSPRLQNVVIKNNSAFNPNGGSGIGGGICLWDSYPVLINVSVMNNSAHGGGGVYLHESSPVLANVIISNNNAIGYNWGGGDGGGICCKSLSNPALQGVTISNNIAFDNGGGIYCNNSSLEFDSINHCNIYFNSAFQGNDLYSDCLMEVVVDTFTVIYPTDYHAHPPEYFSFDILHGKVEQIDADIYVSPEGDNSNSGLTSNDPIKNIYVAFSKILADSLNPHTIHLLEGTYSSSTTEEVFPINMLDYINLSGESQNNVILDAEGQSNVLNLDYNTGSSIMNLTITGGAAGNGGGIVCNNSNVSFQNLTVSNNIATGYGDNKGGGIFCDNSNITMQEMSINNNSADHGGGIYCSGGICPVFENVIITNNYASNNAGGIYCLGGECQDFNNVTISGNVALNDGGGMYLESCTPLFDSINRCNIYLNQAFRGNDLYTNTLVEVIVDTFTVLQPSEFHADPYENFSFDILAGKVEQVDADLYVSPNGDNSNSGLTVNDPLKTILYAFSRIISNSLQQNTIYLLDGIYGPSSNGEIFPLNMLDYYSIAGESDSTVFLDAEDSTNVLTFIYNVGSSISGLTIRGGNSNSGGGIYCYYSNPYLQNMTITENTALSGGGIYCLYAVPQIQNVSIVNNSSSSEGGGICCANSNPYLLDVIITGNNSNTGGAISLDNSSMSLENAELIGNTASIGGAVACMPGSSPEFINVNMSNNSATSNGGAIYCEESYMYLVDVNIEDNTSSGDGGGLYIYDADPIIEEVAITGNTSSIAGGGIYCFSSGLELKNADLINNTSSSGGGIYLQENIFAILENVNILENIADNGGGIWLDNASPEMKNVKVRNNESVGDEGKGGGIFCSEDSNPVLEFVTIHNNSATNGGGIYNASPDIQFHNINRCNIYFNDAVRGNDVYSVEIIELVVDTFTVLYPNDYFAEPFGNFSFDIWNEKIQQVNANLYISPNGSNSNSGLDPTNALQTIKYAFSIIRADSLNPKTFYLLNGTYSSSTNGETMPINVIDYISLVGESQNNTVVDGEIQTIVFEYIDNRESMISNLKIYRGFGHGILLNNSHLVLDDITISSSIFHGIDCQNSNLDIENSSIKQNGSAGIFCENSSVNISNASIIQNFEQGIYCYIGDSLILENSTISGNGDRGLYMYSTKNSILEDLLIEENEGGGIRLGFSDPAITNVIISNNSAINGGGLYCSNNSNPYLENVYITNNFVSGTGGGIYCSYISDPILTNVQITGNTAENDGGGLAILGQCNPMLINTTIASNSSNGVGGAVYCYPNVNLVIINSILWNNIPDEIYGTTLNITFSDVQGGWPGQGNENIDPSFIGSGDYPYALSDQSLCINEGNPDTTGLSLPAFDLAGNNRVRAGRIDMGAFENQTVSTIIQNSQTNNLNFFCSPNPFTDELKISWQQQEPGYTKIELYNSEGKPVKDSFYNFLPGGQHIYQWKTENLKPGIYFVRLQSGVNISNKKIVKY